jgi:hypothetical protein
MPRALAVSLWLCFGIALAFAALGAVIVGRLP